MAAAVRATAKSRRTSQLIIGSFTRAAATEIAGRGLPVDPSQVGTLHALAYRAIERPSVASNEEIAEWNKLRPHLALSSGFVGLDESPDTQRGATDGDKIFSQVEMLRARMVPFDHWPSSSTRRFYSEWTEWKRSAEVIDFCLDVETEVLTSHGWVDGETLKDGDLVRAIDPDTGLAGWEPVVGVYRRRGRRSMVRLNNAVHDSLTTPDHRWLVEVGNGSSVGTRRWRTTEELNSCDRIIRAARGEDCPKDITYADSMVELVAWWYCEGSYNWKGRGGQIGQSHRVNAPYVERIRACLEDLYGEVRSPGTPGKWGLSVSEKRGMHFFLLGGDIVNAVEALAPDKVPSLDFLSQLTRDQLDLFIETSLDADGHRSAGAETFEQVDPRRTDALAFAAVLAGRAVTFHERPDGASLSVTLSQRRLRAVVPGTTSGFATGSRTLVDYEGLIWCPQLAERHNYLARRNGKTFYTGNTDMIELALDNTETAPGEPVVGFFDEAQDFTALELALVRHWGAKMERLVLAGDDDQAIYSFKGVSPDAFLDPPIPDEDKRVLHQSWRVPRAVHAAAQQWVQQLTRREPKDYEPRDADGAVRVAELRGEAPDELVADVLSHLDDRVVDEVTGESRPKTVMILASCSYMLDRVKYRLRDEGVPFHNPYRRRRGDWNPMHATRGTSSAEKLLSYLIVDERIFGDRTRFWTGEDVRRWSSALRKQGVFRRGANAAIQGLPPRELEYHELMALLDADDATLAQMLEPSVEWYASNLLAGSRGGMEYPIAVARRDPLLLDAEPQVILGTIHSVKGGQADVVYLLPDLSLAGMREFSEPGAGRDSVIRLMYVGMTRAREELVLCQPSSPAAVEPHLMLGAQR